MRNFYNIVYLFLLLSSSLFLACDKEEINNNDNGTPLELTAIQEGRNVRLAWTQTKISTFVEYIIVRSDQPIPDDFVPTPFSSLVRERLDEFEDNEFVDDTPLLAETIYYKIYVDINGRFLESNVAEVDYEVTLLSRFPNRVEFNPNNDLLYLFDGSQNSLISFNYKTKETLGEINTNSFQSAFRAGNNGEGEELYAAHNSNQIKVYDGRTLDLKETWDLNNNVVLDIATNDDGQIYAYYNTFSNNLKVIDRASGTSIGNFSESLNNPRLLTLNKNTNEVIAFGNFEMRYLQFSDSGAILEQNSASTNSFPSNNFGFGIAPDGSFFLPHGDGSIYDRDLNLLGFIGSNNIFFEDYAISDDGQFIFSCNNSFLEIRQFSFPDLDLEKTFNFSYFINRIFIDENTLIIVGTVNAKTIIETIDL